MKKSRRAGFTLIEVTIAVSLVAMISLGLLMAMHTGFNAMQKSQDHLMHNRRVVGVERVIEEQVAALVPVTGKCSGDNPNIPGPKFAFFQGETGAVRFVSAYSLREAGRGLPRIVELKVIPGDGGVGVRLVLNERIYAGPFSVGMLCAGMGPDMDGKQAPIYRPVEVGPGSFVLADKLAACGFAFREPAHDGRPSRWLNHWSKDILPDAIQIAMAPLVPDPSYVQLLPLTIPIPVTRQPLMAYDP